MFFLQCWIALTTTLQSNHFHRQQDIKLLPDQRGFPQKQQDFLHGEVWGAAAAEPGYHGEQHDGQGVFPQRWLTCNSNRENDGENDTVVLSCMQRLRGG